jgi:hypothetical protein
MWPFNPRDLFKVNKHAQATVVKDAPPIVVVDDFYESPEKVRDLVLAMPYPIWKHNAQSKNFVDYYDCRHRLTLDYPEPQQRIAEIAHQYMRIRILASTRLFSTNVFRLIHDQRPDTNAHPHCDGIAVAALVYLNTDDECSGGTAFYRNRRLQLEQLPHDTDGYDRLSKEIFQGDELEDGTDYFHEWQEAWEVAQLVEMRFNRLLIWPGVAFHGAWHKHNSFKDTWRINQVFFWDEIDYIDG